MLESHISKLLIIQPTSQAFLSPSSRRDVVLQRCALLQLHMRSQRNFLRMSENSASSWPCSWVLPDKEGKQTVQNQSICLNFLGWWCYKKKLGYQKLLCKHEVMHVMHSLARSFPHQRHMPVMLKSSLWKDTLFITTASFTGCKFSSTLLLFRSTGVCLLPAQLNKMLHVKQSSTSLWRSRS